MTDMMTDSMKSSIYAGMWIQSHLHVFYTAHMCSPNQYCSEYQLDLTECQTGQSHFVTAIELLRGKYSYTSELRKTDDGLLIPNLTIKKYTMEDINNE